MIGKYSLSLAMIGRNEADIVFKCLDSVKGLVDEVVFVDTGSTDNTQEVVRQHVDKDIVLKIVCFPWIDDFAAARNVSFEHCTGDFILWCFHPEAKVHTKSGLVPISLIRVGDLVLTHSGIYKKVTRVYVRDYSGPVYRIKTRMSEEGFLVTPNHEFYGAKSYKCKIDVDFCTPNCAKQWTKRRGKIVRQCKQGYADYSYSFTPIQEFQVGDILSYPRRKQDIYENPIIEVPKLSHSKVVPDKIEVTPEFMKLIGYYVAEGTSGKNGLITFCFHAKEIEYQDDVLFLMKKFFGLKGKKEFRPGPKGGGCNVWFSSKRVGNLFYGILSGLQPTRCLPPDWLGLSDQHLIEFLRSYYMGDGGENSDAFAITTTIGRAHV